MMHRLGDCVHVCMHVYRHAHSLSVYTCFSVFITKSINTLSLSIHHPHTLSGYASLRLSTQCAYRVFKSVHLSVYAYRHAHSLCLQTCTQSLVHTVSTSIHLSVYPHTQSIETFKERASKRELQSLCGVLVDITLLINKDVHLTRLCVERAWKPIARVSATSLAETDGTGSRGGSASTSCFNLMLQLNVYPHSVCHIAHSLYVSTSLHSSQGILVDMTHEQRGAPYMTLPSIQTYTFNHSCLVAQSP